ncbi:MAG: iron ABC transporter permease [Deltaproteobacteria bacterium]|nr:iron ABC transporter permease [Deltaproteobacteria bacterium]
MKNRSVAIHILRFFIYLTALIPGFGLYIRLLTLGVFFFLGFIAEKNIFSLIRDSILVFLAVFLFYPIIFILREGFFDQGHFTLSFLFSIFENPLTRNAIGTSFTLAIITVIISFIISVPLAYFTVKSSFSGKAFLAGLILLPLILPPFVGAIGARQLLARFGTVNLFLMNIGIISSPIDFLGQNKFWGVAILQSLHLFPIMYLNVVSALANVDPNLEDAARNMGTPPLGIFRKILMPLSAPGVFAGSIIVFIWAFTDLGTPLVFEYREVVPLLIFDRISDMGDNPEGFALVVMVMLISLASYSISRIFLKKHDTSMLSKNRSSAREWKPPFIAALFIRTLFIIVIVISILPHLAVILTSFSGKWFMTPLPETLTTSHYSTALSHELTVPSITNSIIYATIATVLDLILGIGLAWLVSRSKKASARYLDILAMLPLALPGIVIAFGYLASFNGSFLDPRKDAMWILIFAYSVRRLPYILRSAHAGFSQVNDSLEEAAVNLGSSQTKALRTITLPLITSNLVAGGILVFCFAMLEVSDSLILALKTNSFPITKAIYVLMGRVDDGLATACALGVWSMVFLGISLMLANSILGKKMGELFR